MRYTIFSTRIGYCGLVYHGDDGESRALHVFLPGEYRSIEQEIRRRYPDASLEADGFRELRTQIGRFLNGEPINIPMDLVDTSVCYPFQLRVLLLERTIPRGRVASYSWLAEGLRTNAVRAVGSALARNPFPLIVPCHRAVRIDGSVGGFQGGPEMKRRLLEMEGVEFDTRGRVQNRLVLRPRDLSGSL